MIDARDHLEHFEERLPGGTKRHLLHQQHDLFNMVGDHMTFGGRKFDVGRKSVEVLGAIVAELRDAILFDSLEVLAGADPKLLIRRLRQAQRDASTARLIRRAEAEFQKRTPAEPNAR